MGGGLERTGGCGGPGGWWGGGVGQQRRVRRGCAWDLSLVTIDQAFWRVYGGGDGEAHPSEGQLVHAGGWGLLFWGQSGVGSESDKVCVRHQLGIALLLTPPSQCRCAAEVTGVGRQAGALGGGSHIPLIGPCARPSGSVSGGRGGGADNRGEQGRQPWLCPSTGEGIGCGPLEGLAEGGEATVRLGEGWVWWLEGGTTRRHSNPRSETNSSLERATLCCPTL